jgi:hypothetical protein
MRLIFLVSAGFLNSGEGLVESKTDRSGRQTYHLLQLSRCSNVSISTADGDITFTESITKHTPNRGLFTVPGPSNNHVSTPVTLKPFIEYIYDIYTQNGKKPSKWKKA